MILKKIQSFFSLNIELPPSPEEKAHALNLAIAAIFYEMVLSDSSVNEEEWKALQNLVQEHLSINETEADELAELAQLELQNATDYYQFTQLINSHYDREEKIAIIESLWRIAYADNHIDHHEVHYLRKIADLLHVPHSDFIKAKFKVIPHQ